ncbi:Teashirt 1 [Liparis tanakae]|uniref:Teashirt 1 n=1 Tax=Liparis tanakae TaxID=230148 RepID=A0A4Z2I2L2_9TELE|nr:Teashirt 1 [Liparis tanakae]
MPRRKQQAPRRSAAYGSEDEFKEDKIGEEEHLQDDGLSLDGQEDLFNDDDDAGDRYSCQNSPLSNGTNPDAGYASPLSTTSDHLVDLKTTPPLIEQDKVEEKQEEKTEPINGISLQDSLAKMKTVYANLISDASWSSIALDMLKSKQGNNYAASNDNGSNHKGSNGFMNSHSPVNIHLKSRGNTSNASAATNTTIGSTTSRAVSSNSGTSVSSGSTGGLAYDWHQAALAKTFQHTPYQLLPEPSLFSTVQLYRQNNKLYGPVFTGASKFRCKDCSGAYDTLVGLTVHMHETGHYRDDNKDKEDDRSRRWSKPRKRSLLEMEGKEDAQKPTSPEERNEELKDEELEEEQMEGMEPENKIKEEKEDPPEKADKPKKTRSYQYLREEDLEEAPKGGLDILKSLENTVSSAISKAQTGTPTWGGYPSIHAAYQLHGSFKSTLPSCGQVQPLFSSKSLKSIMNNHLGKAAKVATPFVDPFAMLYKINNSSAQVKSAEPVSQYCDDDDDQPIDLTKSKNTNGSTPTGASTPNNGSVNNSKPSFKDFSQSSSPLLRENALMDISDMVKNLTGRLTPKSTTPSSISEKSDHDGCTFEDSLEELSPIQRRKGRQSNWNPQHLLILQAQFVSSLRETTDGKLVVSDLGPQERVHICKFTGLSMTTISHWLANMTSSELDYVQVRGPVGDVSVVIKCCTAAALASGDKAPDALTKSSDGFTEHLNPEVEFSQPWSCTLRLVGPGPVALYGPAATGRKIEYAFRAKWFCTCPKPATSCRRYGWFL